MIMEVVERGGEVRVEMGLGRDEGRMEMEVG